ncbi:hypothetical protein BGZ70_005209 [Mortierella alpina]|uniref:Uncharacterized protein n=1 Tax=Mortierella alpina TaxID=64518 RepID=A0A9P6IPS8_MORAP|nr:hypothetical protein BGZ70_005209 [Mortierella alpina]
MAANLSATSEDSCWIGSGLARTGAQTSAFKERDWANGRVYYEAHYIFRLGLEDLLMFMKSEPSTAKYYPSLENKIKELKQELR